MRAVPFPAPAVRLDFTLEGLRLIGLAKFRGEMFVARVALPSFVVSAPEMLELTKQNARRKAARAVLEQIRDRFHVIPSESETDPWLVEEFR